MDSNKIAEKLRGFRGGVPRRHIADQIGITESALRMYEAGERIPRDEIKIKLANYYGTTVENLFFAN